MNKKIIIIASKFNQEISQGLVNGAKKACDEENIAIMDIKWVAGAFELPLISDFYLKNCDGIIACGVIIKGETAHFESVCDGCTQGIMSVMLNHKKPIAFSVLMTYSRLQAEARSQNNEKNKGYTSTKALVDSLELIKNEF